MSAPIELDLDALEAAALAATPQNLDSAEEVVKADPGAMIECPICCGEGYASLENDYCNFDNEPVGVQFYGIGTVFGAAESYYRAANPATILELIRRLRVAEVELAGATERAKLLLDAKNQWADRARAAEDAANIQVTDRMISAAQEICIGFGGEGGTYNDYLTKDAAKEVLEAAMDARADQDLKIYTMASAAQMRADGFAEVKPEPKCLECNDRLCGGTGIYEGRKCDGIPF